MSRRGPHLRARSARAVSVFQRTANQEDTDDCGDCQDNADFLELRCGPGRSETRQGTLSSSHEPPQPARTSRRNQTSRGTAASSITEPFDPLSFVKVASPFPRSVSSDLQIPPVLSGRPWHPTCQNGTRTGTHKPPRNVCLDGGCERDDGVSRSRQDSQPGVPQSQIARRSRHRLERGQSGRVQAGRQGLQGHRLRQPSRCRRTASSTAPSSMARPSPTPSAACSTAAASRRKTSPRRSRATPSSSRRSRCRS